MPDKMMRKLKENNILILMPQLFMGGSEQQVRYIVEGLENASVRSTVLVENGSMLDDECRNYVEKHKDVHFIFLGLNTVGVDNKTVKNKIKSLLLLYKWIFLHGDEFTWSMFTNLTGLMCVPVCKAKGIRVLFNERNPGVKMCNSSLKRRLLKSCDKVVANSKSASEYMSKKLKTNVECINNGILEKKLPKSEIEGNTVSILVPARITPVKNQMVVLRAIEILRKKINISCCFAGQVEDQEYNEELLRFVRGHQLEKYVSFPGYVSQIDEMYARADLVILPSFEEGTPNVVLEAYYNMKLCLASNIIMNRDIAVDSRILFETEDAADLAKKIIWILGINNNEKRILLNKSYQYVKENYSITSMQTKYLKILL